MVDWGKVDVEEEVWVVHTVGGGVERVERLREVGPDVATLHGPLIARTRA